jgi:hypothetical protein
MSSVSGLALPRRGGKSVAAEAAADSGKVALNDVIGSLSRSARLLTVEAVDVEAADVSEAGDDAEVSEASDGRRMRVYLSSSSGVLNNVAVVANEAVEVVALPFTSNVFIVSIDDFKPVESNVSRLSFA